MSAGSLPGKSAPGRRMLVDSPCFRIEHLTLLGASVEVADRLPHYSLFMSLSGEGTFDGRPFSKGEMWFVPAGADSFAIQGNAEWLVSYAGKQGSLSLRTV